MKPRYIAHTGGPMPVPYLTPVEVVFKGKDRETGHARAFNQGASEWEHKCRPRDCIIAYRVIEQE